MDLKVGDLVAFKKYEDMTERERSGISKDVFPEFGTVAEIYNSIDRFVIKEAPYTLRQGSIDYVISDNVAVDIHVGDEVLMKVTVGEIRENYIWVSWVDKSDIVKVLKRKEERFIVKEDHYGMYVNGSGVLIADKRHAKIYNSRNEANDEAADMHLNAWDVIPYGD